MKMEEGWYSPVYSCKLCGKHVVDKRPTQGISDEDIDGDLEILHEHTTLLKENTKLHSDIESSECFGLCSIIGFQYDKDG